MIPRSLLRELSPIDLGRMLFNAGTHLEASLAIQDDKWYKRIMRDRNRLLEVLDEMQSQRR